MIQSVTVTNHLGESLIFELRSPEKSGFFVRSVEGLGPSKGVVNTTEVLSSDGAFYNSSRVVSRNIVFDIGFLESPSETIEALRQKTYRFFPMKNEITIKVNTDTRVGVTTGYVESNEPNIFSQDEGAHISVICPRAYFYGEDIIQSFFSGVSSKFEFPFENPSTSLSLIEMGTVFIDTQKSVVYNGDDDTGVTIYISVKGAVNNLTIVNTLTGETMAISSAKIIALTGSDLIAGDQIIISTLRGSKYIHLIRAGVTINILNALGTSASWFRLIRGDNLFVYTAASGLANLQFLIEHRLVYGGM